MLVICINGASNSGKTTVGRLLGARVPGAFFVDGDDHDAHGAPLERVIEAGVGRLVAAVGEHTGRARVLVLAFPLRERDYLRVRGAAEAAGAETRCVTLAPALEVARSRRGARRLSEAERVRVGEMYAEGYDRAAFSDLVVDNGGLTADETVERVMERVEVWLSHRSL